MRDTTNFHNCFFIKVLQTALLKKKKKSYQKTVKSTKNSWHSNRQKKNNEKLERKRKIRKTQATAINIFFLFVFYLEKFIFNQKRYLEKLSYKNLKTYIVTFVLTFLHVVICPYRWSYGIADTVFRPKRLANRLGILT